MREIFTYGSVGRAPGNRCLYPEADSQGGVALAVWNSVMPCLLLSSAFGSYKF